MTVGELIEILLELNPKLPIFVSRDEEGNGFNPLTNVGTYFGTGEESDGVIYNEDEFDLSEYEEDEYQRIVVIWP